MATLNLPWDDKEYRIETDRADLQPIYQGFAPSETPTSARAWVIYKYAYASGGDITRRQVRFKISWDDRATIF